MSLCVCVPCYGQVETKFMQSMLDLQEAFIDAGFPFELNLTIGDSLVNRARNTLASTFLRMTDCQKMLFIDSDIEFTPEDVSQLWNLQVPVACAAYRMKRPDSVLSAWIDGELVTDLERYTEPVACTYAGTGFLMIDREVLAQMRDAWPEIEYEESVGTTWNFFDPHVDLKQKVLLSEDYAFCKRCTELGIPIILHPGIRLGHWGSYRYG